jgi:adenylate cyclase
MKDNTSSAVHAEHRRLAAIMFTDIVGFSRQMGSNETRTLRLLEVHNEIIQRAVAAHHGQVIKTVGDAFLVDFPSVVNAVQCAQQIQARFQTHNADKEPVEQIHVRIGIHSGDIVRRAGDVFGDGVNIAARLQELAEPDALCISQVVYQEIEQKLPLGRVVSLGQPALKNITQRFPVYLLYPEHEKDIRQTLRARRIKLFRSVGTVSRVVAVVLLLGGAGIVGNYFHLLPLPGQPQRAAPTDSTPLPPPDKPSIAVLPFANMSGDPEQEYFSDGITEDLTSDLSKISSLFVIARNSAFTYKGKAVKVQDVSQEMGVRYVLEGSVRKAGDQVRISAQLIDATTGGHLWSGRYDQELRDIFALQDDIRQKIVTALKVTLTLDEQERFRRAPTSDLEAYDYYLRGTEYLWRNTKETNTQARQLFKRALALDPQYAGAYALLSWTYATDWQWQWSQDRQTLERALAAAQQAVALDDSLPLAHSVLGVVYQQKGQSEQAIAAGERAVALDPNNPDSYERLSFILGQAGRAEEAITMAKQAMRLNPRYPPQYILRLGVAYHQAWRNEEAIATFKRFLAYNPNSIVAYVALTCSYSDAGRDEEARAQATEVLRLSPNFTTEAWRRNQFFSDPAELERHVNNLRKVGLK